jgi:hypothetical protein
MLFGSVKGDDVLQDAEMCEEKRKATGTGMEHFNASSGALCDRNV